MSTVLDTPASGLLLKRARYNAGLTKQELARRVGVTRRTITNWEEGDIPWPHHAKAVADVFGVKATDIFDIGADA